MKREVIFIFAFVFLLISISSIYADELQQVENAYSCIQDKIDNSVNCTTFSIEEKVFAALATGECINQTSRSNITKDECWADLTGSKTCTLKATAQSILALNTNDKVDTTKAENWLLKQTASPTGIDWYLEIESPEETNCDITYLGNTYKISIDSSKKINKAAGSLLVLQSGNPYWLRISKELHNKDILVSCDREFITTLLFTRTGSQTIHVSDYIQGAGPLGETTVTVNSLCFAQDGTCNYEGSLWASLVLKSLGYNEEIKKFLPYLITMKDDTPNIKYIPESFLYYITGEFRTELLLKQYLNSYWKESGKIYYDTALALLPFSPEDSSTEKDNSIKWLLGVQQKTGTNAGCWNSGNFRDTAFILYSIWPKKTSIIIPPGECSNNDNSFCPQPSAESCEEALCNNEDKCYTSPIECSDGEHCEMGDCVENTCVQDGCPEGETCNEDSGICEPGISIECSWLNPCPSGKHCVSKECVENTCEQDGCPEGQTCENEECVEGGDGTVCSWLKSCPSGEHCVSGECIGNTCEQDGCPEDQVCENEECVEGTICSWFKSCPEGEHCLDGVCEINTCEQDGCPEEQVCEFGECIIGGESCSFFNPCPEEQHCVDGYCINNTCEQDGCLDGQVCEEGECIEDNTCGIFKPCPEGETCTDGLCVTAGCETDGCPEVTCKESFCDIGSCSYEFFECANNDNCCNPGCNFSVDNDCPPGPECTTNSECAENNYESYPLCSDNGNVYVEFYNYTCKNQTCVDNMTEKLIDDCNSTEDCYAGECYYVEPIPCEDDYGCDYEQCVDGECVPFECTTDDECDSGTCTDEGYCLIPEVLDCEIEGYSCVSSAACENGGGNPLDEYFCTGIFTCCDTAPVLGTCEDDNAGEICSSDKVCTGTEVTVSDEFTDGEVCCVGGTCEDISSITYCIDKGATCKSECDSTEEEKDYICSEGETCCMAGEEPPASKLWIWIIILLLLIGLSVVGIVFRDKLRVQWIKLKDKLGGKKEKKKFDMPTASVHPNPNMQGRILPRRILPPGQQPTGPPMRRPGYPPQGSPQNRPSTGNVQPGKATTSQQTKKPEEKSKGKGELDDVLKKLRDMSK